MNIPTKTKKYGVEDIHFRHTEEGIKAHGSKKKHRMGWSEWADGKL